MTVSLRIDARSPSHVTLSVFVNHGHAGTLTLRVEEFDDLLAQIRAGSDGFKNLCLTITDD